MTTIKAIRGMNDVLPGETPAWQHVEHHARTLLGAYGYEEIRPPLIERTELFRRSIGEVTDIVEKEMYTFDDRNGESLTLRPECTASVVRAAIEHGLLRTPGQRVWAMGPMFRHERPQKGRYRQFHQIDVEILGIASPSAEAELIVMTRRLWKALGVSGLKLELNSLGNRDVQARYRAGLVEYFSARASALDADSRRRLRTNPLRILDSKDPSMQTLIEEAPRIIDAHDGEARAHLDRLLAMLDEAGVEYRLNPRLVRGLDYYTGTVFEWTTGDLGAQNAVCGGGRYDNLVAEIGGPASPRDRIRDRSRTPRRVAGGPACRTSGGGSARLPRGGRGAGLGTRARGGGASSRRGAGTAPRGRCSGRGLQGEAQARGPQRRARRASASARRRRAADGSR